MKYIVLSDIHGSLFYMQKIMNIIEKEEVEKVILLGDLYYHGPRNSLPEQYNPMEVCKLLNSIKDKIYCVKGNCDAEVDEMISEFKFDNHLKIIKNNKTLMFTHGHKYNIDNPIENVDVLIYGHYHTGFIKKENNIIYVNAGSVSLPKNDTKNSYLIIDDNKIYLKDLNMAIIDEIEY